MKVRIVIDMENPLESLKTLEELGYTEEMVKDTYNQGVLFLMKTLGGNDPNGKIYVNTTIIDDGIQEELS